MEFRYFDSNIFNFQSVIKTLALVHTYKSRRTKNDNNKINIENRTSSEICTNKSFSQFLKGSDNC